MTTIAEAWEQLESTLVPLHFSPEAKIRLKVAFYIGVMTMYKLGKTASNPPVTEEEGEHMMEGIRAELFEFKAGMEALLRTLQERKR